MFPKVILPKVMLPKVRGMLVALWATGGSRQTEAHESPAAARNKGDAAMQVKDIMTANPICCTADTSLTDAARMLAENDCGALPVVDTKTRMPVGMITDRDIVCRSLALGRDPMAMRVRDCMSGPCITVAPASTLDVCVEAMEVNQVRRLVVVDEDGRACGIVAQADIANVAPRETAAEVVRVISRHEPLL